MLDEGERRRRERAVLSGEMVLPGDVLHGGGSISDN
jgi:hypothetical protein